MPTQSVEPRFPWAWYAALVVAAAAAGIGFAISPKLGIPLACLAAILAGSFMVWAAREGRRRRSAGWTPDLGRIQRRMRTYAKWGAVLAVLAVVTSVQAVATNDDQTPTWLLVMPPVLITFGVAFLSLLAWVIVPRQRRDQTPGSGT